MTTKDRPPLDAEQQALKDRFISERGYWSRVWEEMIRLSPEFFASYLDLSATPWRSGPLDAKTKELIYIALDANAAHMYEPGLRIHMRNALRHGATRDEIFEVLQLATTIGVHACTVGIPVLLEEMARQEEDASTGSTA